MPSNDLVLISGGGPVGLFCGLLLGRQGVAVRIFDVNPCLQDDPRAATTHPATLEVLDEAGLVEEMARVGLTAPTFQFWDRPSGRLVAEFDHALLAQDTRFPYVIQCEQFKTSKILMERLKALPNVEVRFNSEVVRVEQTADRVEVAVRSPAGEERHVGAWLIGADGGRSTVRKQIGVPFEGFTWEERFLVLTTPFDFKAELGYCERSYFADPDEWCNCFKVAADGPPGLWRTVFPARNDEPVEQIMSDESVQRRLQKFFPTGKPYDVVHRNLYVTHQRVAATFRLGRVMLAGDSAHVNNSIGGMGLNGGLQDAANLSEKLAKVILDGAPDALLDLYSAQRRTVSIEFVQEQSIANKKRLEAKDAETRKANLDDLARTAADPAKARDFLLRSSMITMQRRADSITLETV
ncbi:MAG TPA: FAD-dependent monooxygenase [Beijerinckiaceae bacterium]